MASIDTALFVDQPDYGAESVLIAGDVSVSLGGKGLIAAIAIGREGIEVAPLSLVGEESNLVRMVPPSVGKEWLVPGLAGDVRIWLSVAGGEHVVAWIAPGRQLIADEAVEKIAAKYTDSLDMLYIALEAVSLIRAAFESAERRGIPIAANLSRPLVERLSRQEPTLLRRLVAKAELILCNGHESALVLSALHARSWREIAAPSAEIVVTRGENGGEVARTPFEHWVRYDAVPPTTVRSVVGAGDTFNGAFLAARWVRGLSTKESCERAATLAAECVASSKSSIATM
jgi:sugar/nucleoside kinase (ribokinase family)